MSGVLQMRYRQVPKHAPLPRQGETPWFPGHQLPVQIGVYRRLTLARGGTSFSWFNGTDWYWSADTPTAAAAASQVSLVQDLPWCGLIAPPPQGYGPMVAGGGR